MSIEASEIRRLSQKFDSATEDWEKDKILAQLDRIADERSSGRLAVSGEDTVEEEEAIALLAGCGSFSVAASFAASRPWSQDKVEDHKTQEGLSMLHLDYDEIDRLSAAFAKGRIPATVVNAVVGQQDQIGILHPDKHPFDISVYDVLANGLDQEGFNTRRIWGNLQRALTRKGNVDLARRYNFGGPTDAVIGFLVDYALTKQDIAQLDRTGREIHF